jgi:arylsulfatase A-like enzyme
MLAIWMKEAGFQTAMIGKWDLKDEPADFDYFCVLPGQGEYHNPQFLVRGEKQHRTCERVLSPSLTPGDTNTVSRHPKHHRARQCLR